jgi:hypothetical protein
VWEVFAVSRDSLYKVNKNKKHQKAKKIQYVTGADVAPNPETAKEIHDDGDAGSHCNCSIRRR